MLLGAGTNFVKLMRHPRHSSRHMPSAFSVSLIKHCDKPLCVFCLLLRRFSFSIYDNTYYCYFFAFAFAFWTWTRDSDLEIWQQRASTKVCCRLAAVTRLNGIMCDYISHFPSITAAAACLPASHQPARPFACLLLVEVERAMWIKVCDNQRLSDIRHFCAPNSFACARASDTSERKWLTRTRRCKHSVLRVMLMHDAIFYVNVYELLSFASWSFKVYHHHMPE